jgi:hypothetical protein
MKFALSVTFMAPLPEFGVCKILQNALLNIYFTITQEFQQKISM